MDKYEIYMKKFTGKTNENNSWLVFVGLLMFVLGTCLLAYVFIAEMITVYFIGGFVIISGILQLVGTYKVYEGFRAFFWLIVAIAYIVTGILVILSLLVTSFDLINSVAIAFIGIGIFKILASVELKPFSGWHWCFFSGIISILTGILIIKTLDGFTEVIYIFIALDIVFHGAIYIVISSAIKSLKEGEK
ncbi:MAG: DUF308 domain-containing protein [Campylobacteraceae bacterium]|jgi:uncharacterized membrane protein HdeD (DUF308 family)|nr:DUF308 domain-containing protein [Campylobacteraceae bacterium]